MKFDSYHPAINFIFFIAVIAMTICFTHPVFLAISYVCSFAYSVKLGGKGALLYDLGLILFIGVWTWFFSAFNHFGITDLGENFVGNHMTLESVVFGFVVGVIIASVLMWVSCMHKVVSSDKVVYMLGRISPKLSLFVSILLRMGPRIRTHARIVNVGQKCIGRGSGQGGFARRFSNCIRRLSIMVTWTLESMIQTSESMRSRGYTLKGRTAFSIYRFDNRDRSLVIFMFLCLTLVLMGVLLDQTTIDYNPMIVMNRITWVSFFFYVAYAVFALTPMALQIIGEARFSSLRGSVQRQSGIGYAPIEEG